ncbi:MAG: hypothetical protein ACUVXE_07795 [Anaerolineae bacterium]
MKSTVIPIVPVPYRDTLPDPMVNLWIRTRRTADAMRIGQRPGAGWEEQQ